MNSGAPWSVKGIDPKAREVAKDLARRHGMTLGEWLNRMILEEDGPEDISSEAYFTDPNYASPRAFAAERPVARTYLETPRVEPSRAAEPPLRPEPLYVAPTRFEVPQHPGDEINRVTAALDRLTDRIESSEGRTGMAISGVEHSVREAVARIESAEREHVAIAARFEGAVDDTRTEQARLADHLRRIESEAAGPRSAKALRALEQALGRVANHLYEGENRTRETLADLRQRVEQAEAGAPTPGVDAIEDVVERVGERLTEAEARTFEALESLRASFAGLDGRLGAVETVAAPAIDQRFQQLTANLTERVELTRGELAKSLQASTETRFDRMERKLSEMTEQVQAAEQRSAQAIERVGREVLTVADNLNKRVEASEIRSADAIGHVGGEVARIAETVDLRLTRNDSIQAEAMEKLGAEIARISERLAERIATAERRSAQAFDEVGEQVARVTERVGQRSDRASDELIDRIRQSEERTARLLDEAREKIDQRLSETQRRITEQVVAVAPPLLAPRSLLDGPTHVFGEPEPFPAFEKAADSDGPFLINAKPLTQAATMMTRSGFATPPPVRPAAPPAAAAAQAAAAPAVFAPEPFAPEPFAPQAFAPEPAVSEPAAPSPFSVETLLSEAIAPERSSPFAASPFAAEPFPAEPEGATFDAEDFEAADDFISLSEDAPGSEHQAAPEPEQAEAAAPRPSLFGGAFEDEDAEDHAPQEHRAEASAFDDLDLEPQAPAYGASVFGATAFDSKEDETPAAAAEEHLLGATAVELPPVPDTELSPLQDAGPAAPLSTRQVIEQARAAARSSVQDNGKIRPFQGAKPKAEKPAKPAGGSIFDGLFGGRGKRRAGSSLQSALVITGTAALVGLGAAGFILMDGRPGGSPPQRVADAIAALSAGKPIAAAESDTTPFPATPRVAMALAPQPIAPATGVQTTTPDLSDRFARAAQAVEQKKPGALDELKAVAELGHAPAQFYLARLYEKGDGGLKPDLAQSRRWTERAAEGGDRRAMHNLAMAYIGGSGGPKNSTTAAQWFRRAAELGLVDSQFNLAALYEKGMGVSQNPAEAYKWYMIAAKTGDADARKRADQVKAQLSPDARVVAEQAAAAFRANAANPSAGTTTTATSTALGTDLSGVIVAQRALSRLGYYLGPTDGSASPALQLAVAAYQRDHNTQPTGVLDPATLQGLTVYTR
jgi:localization factor PodJL